MSEYKEQVYPQKSEYLSQVPDLIHGDYSNKRVQGLCQYFQPPNYDLPPYFHRITLFVTYKCNLNCVYCKTIHKPEHTKSTEMNLEHFKQFLSQLSVKPVKHIHFTGGEATLVSDLPAMVRLARQQGILCSTTSNGMSDQSVYQKLIKAGLTEIRFSVDSHEPAEFNKIVRHPAAYTQVIKNIKYITHLRDHNQKTPFVIINMCIGKRNRRNLPELVAKSLALNPDDLKLITMVQSRNDQWDFEEQSQILKEIKHILSKYSPQQFPLLRLKLKTLFSAESIGLKDLQSKQLFRKCFIPLTERTADSKFYYPCSVYLRERGEPLGRLDQDDLKTQQQKIVEFVQAENCLDDPICKEYCINCCKNFNLLANSQIHRTIREKNGHNVPINFEVTTEIAVPWNEVEKKQQLIELERKNYRTNKTLPSPFLVVKPNGIKHRNEIRKILKEEKIQIRSERYISDWNEVALRIYYKPNNKHKIWRGLILKNALPQIEGFRSALVWIVQAGIELSRLKSLKERIREIFIPQHCLIISNNELATTSISFVHTPDQSSFAWEYAVILNHSSVINEISG